MDKIVSHHSLEENVEYKQQNQIPLYYKNTWEIFDSALENDIREYLVAVFPLKKLHQVTLVVL